MPPPKRKRVRKGLTTGRVPTKATHTRHVWTWDFVADITTVGGTFRILALIDEHTKACVGYHVARSINAHDVMRSLARAISEYGAPEYIRSDNGSEFIARVVRDGLAARNIKTLYIGDAQGVGTPKGSGRTHPRSEPITKPFARVLVQHPEGTA